MLLLTATPIVLLMITLPDPLLVLPPVLEPVLGPQTVAANEPKTTTDDADAKTATPVGLTDAPLPASHVELLELAFSAADAIPIQPQIKARSREQEVVIDALFDLDQPQRALAFSERIANWRRGNALARYAHALAEDGQLDAARQFIEQAEEIATGPDAKTQDWRASQIQARIAQVYLLLGETERVAAIEAAATTRELAPLVRQQAEQMDEADVDAWFDDLGIIIEQGNFGTLNNALIAATAFHSRFYDDEKLRERFRKAVVSTTERLPPLIRLERNVDLIENALAHDDTAMGLELVEETQLMADRFDWLPEDHVRWTAKLAGLRARAGDPLQAEAMLVNALEMFDAEKYRIVDIYRADALRPVAEAYGAMGKQDEALDVYRRVIEAGVENPNSVPRAEDFIATCLSLVQNGVEPPEAITERLTEVRDGLGDPW